MSNSSREKILSKIKESMEEGREYTIPLSDSVKSEFPKPTDLLDTFCEELKAIGGNVISRPNNSDILLELKNMIAEKGVNTVFCVDSTIQNELNENNIQYCIDEKEYNNMEASITRCEYLISRTGSLVVSSAQESGRRLNVFPPIHIVLAKKSQLVAFPNDALLALENQYGCNFPSLISFITGASRTADIEKTLVMGAHGPKELYVFIDESR